MKKLLLLAVFIPGIFTSCFFSGKRVKGNGNIQSQERTVSSFNKVEVHGSIDVIVIQGDLKPVRIEADENLIEYIEIIQKGNELTIKNRDDYNLQSSKDIKVYVTSPVFRSIDVSGACDIIGQTKIDSKEDLQLSVSGAGEINMEVDVPEIKTNISGSGTVTLKGETREFNLGLSGAGNAHCYNLLSENTKVDISGAGDAEVYASVKLDAEVSGAGTVSYKGNAKSVKQEVSGAGSVKKVD